MTRSKYLVYCGHETSLAVVLKLWKQNITLKLRWLLWECVFHKMNWQLAQNQSSSGAIVKFTHRIWNHLIMHCGLSHMIMLPNDPRRHTHQILGGMSVFVDASWVVLRRLAVRLFRCGFAHVVVARRKMVRFGTVGVGRENPMMLRARVSARVTEINNEIDKYYIKQHMWVCF